MNRYKNALTRGFCHKSGKTIESSTKPGHVEGGYDFLKRALAQNLETCEPVILNTGRAYLRYHWEPGQEHFIEGVTVIEEGDAETMNAFNDCASRYRVRQGLEEIRNTPKNLIERIIKPLKALLS